MTSLPTASCSMYSYAAVTGKARSSRVNRTDSAGGRWYEVYVCI